MVWTRLVSLRRKAFLVGIQDGDQPAFGNVQALAQQVDADKRHQKLQDEDRG